jgi:hypothetical protein
MRSVADDLRVSTLAHVRALQPSERVSLALRLGDSDLDAFESASGLDRAAAQVTLRRRRQAGRRTSCCMLERLA